MDNTKELKHISLCTGYGGIDLGLSRALRDVRTVCYVEIEAYAVQNLVTKIEAGLLDAAPIFTDLKQFPWHIFSGKVDILSGGFPCQPFSQAGEKQADSDPRHLWPYIKQGIRELNRPPIIFLENVEGIISAKLKGDKWADPAGTSVLQHVLRELERLGYKAEAGLFSASEVGAPHQRKRVFILGVRNDLGPSGYKFIRDRIKAEGNKTAWPTYRGQKQYEFEPQRVTMGHANSKRLQTCIQGISSTNKEVWEVKDRHFIYTNHYRLGKSKYSNDNKIKHCTVKAEKRQIKPKMGRDVNGGAYRVDYENLYQAFNNRADELRLLGNGVVPDQAALSFKELWKLLHEYKSTI